MEYYVQIVYIYVCTHVGYLPVTGYQYYDTELLLQSNK